MRQYLQPKSGQFYKVNMHSQSNLSDGRQSAEELKEAYLALRYSAIAFTEHGKLHNRSHLTDDRFVAIVFYELDPDDGYFRIGAHDAAGKHANTRAYFMEELQ